MHFLFIKPGNQQLLYGETSQLNLTAIEPPFWPLLLASYLKKQGVEVRIIDLEVDHPNRLTYLLAHYRPTHTVICVSGHNPTASMMNMVGALDVPTRGQIFLDGKDIATLTETKLARIRGQKIGFVFQSFNLIPTLNCMENVEIPMFFQDKPEKESMKRAKELLELVGLGARIKHRPSELSGGEMQRVAIARALANDPEIILADEPTGNLDSKSSYQIMEIFKKIYKEGKTIILVTHEPDIAEYAKRLVRLKDGKIIQDVRKR